MQNNSISSLVALLLSSNAAAMMAKDVLCSNFSSKCGNLEVNEKKNVNFKFKSILVVFLFQGWGRMIVVLIPDLFGKFV